MEDGLHLVLWVAMLMVMSFVLGASVMWALESKKPRMQPLWLTVARNLAMIGLVALVFFGQPAPTRIVKIDPTWWAIIGVATLIAGVTALVLELRVVLRNRQTA